MNSYNIKILAAIALSMAGIALSGQGVAVNNNGSSPDSSAILDIQSTNKGVIFPRLSTWQIRTIPGPATGLMVFNMDSLELYIYTGDCWESVRNASDTIPKWNCGKSFYYEGLSYNTVQIGAQCWMAGNLNAGAMINGSQEQENNSIIERYCYNNDENQCDIYGGLYQWAEMVQYLNGATNFVSWDPVPSGYVRGICPEGWHLPSHAEWDTLIIYCGYSGGKLKETGTEHWYPPNTGATDEFGFTALPGGYRHPTGLFAEKRAFGIYWTTTEYIPYNDYLSFFIQFYWDNDGVTHEIGNGKSYGYSVRCLRDY